MVDFIIRFKYVGLFILLIMSAFGFPIPEELPYMLGGFWVYEEYVPLPYILISCFAGVILGDMILFSLGRKYGAGALRGRIIGKFIREEQLHSAERYFSRYGYKMILGARFFAGVRTAVFLAAGALRLKFWKFIVVDLIGICIIVPLFITLGYVFAQNIEHVIKDVEKTMRLLSVIAILAFLAFVIYKSYKFFKSPEQNNNNTKKS